MFRRLSSTQYEGNKALRDGFNRRQTERALSFYLASVVSPRECLQKNITSCLNKMNSSNIDERKKAEKRLQTVFGETVEQAVGKFGWRVARIKLSFLESLGCKISDPNHEGHVEVFYNGLQVTLANELAEEAELLSLEDCLK